MSDSHRSGDFDDPRETHAGVGVNRDLLAMLEEQLLAHVRTVRLLRSAIGDDSLGSRADFAANLPAHAAESAADAWGSLERRRQQLEREGAQLLARSEEHAGRVRQFEHDIHRRLNDITADIFTQNQGDCETSLAQMDELIAALEQAEASISNICGEPSASAVSAPQPATPVFEIDTSLSVDPEFAVPASCDAPEAPFEPIQVNAVASLDEPAIPAQCRRATHRLKVEGLESNLGPVVDLSKGGARVNSSRPLEGEVSFEISASDVTFSVKAKVAWCERETWRHYAAGLQFPELSEDEAQRLTRICMETRKQTTMAA